MADAPAAGELSRQRKTRFGVLHGARRDALDEAAAVLHCDYNGWWAPLQELYYSTSSRCLVSRHPESCVEELVSFYCPQCLSRFLEDEVQQYCHRCPACVLCPLCQATTRVEAVSADACAYRCGFCDWSSEACGLVAPNKSQLETALRVREVEGVAEEAFRMLKETLLAHDKEAAASAALESASPFKSPLRQRRAASLHQIRLSEPAIPVPAERRRAHWKWEDLNAKLAAKNQTNTADESFLPGSVHLPKSAAAQQISAAVEDLRRLAAPSQAEEQQTPTLRQRIQQQHLSTPYTTAHLLPVRVTLRHKLTRRCRKDKDAEKMSILSQPKSLPMEGDSSLLKDAGRWFYKNSSAVGVCPRIIVTQLPLASEFASQRVSRIHFAMHNPFHHHEMRIRLLRAEEAGVETKRDDEAVSDISLTELHPPFAAGETSPVVPLIPAEAIEFTLAVAEDEFLREEKSSHGGAASRQQLPTNDHGFSITVKHHTANVVLPLRLQGNDPLAADALHVFPFHLSVQQLGVGPDEAVELDPMFTLIAYRLQQS